MSTEICPVCKNPKKAQESGSLTQWINLCTCNLVLDESIQTVEVKICANCNKRIDEGRAGSFTQFIFRADTCSCAEPKPRIETQELDQSIQEESYSLAEEADEPELDISEDEFPRDRYKPIARLGKGATGAVFIARDRLLNKKVAVKILHAVTSQQLITFQAEAKATSKFDHPSIIQVLDFGATASGVPFMVLEYIEGKSLEDLLLERKILPWSLCRTIFSEVTDALQYAHDKSIYHRDLNLRNLLLVSEEGQADSYHAKVIDFGLAIVKIEGMDSESDKRAVGTPLYMSPDQGLGREYDARSETYSLACIMFECLTGAPPFSGETAIQTLSMHAEKPPPTLAEKTDQELPEGLEEFFAKALAKEPEKRFQSMKEMKSSIEEIKFAPKPTDTVTISSITVKTGLSSGQIMAIAFLLIGIGGGVIYFQKVQIQNQLKVEAAKTKKEKLATATMPRDEKMVEDLKDMKIFGYKWDRENGKLIGVEVIDEDFKELKLRPNDLRLSIHGGSMQFSGTGLQYIVGHKLNAFESMTPSFTDKGLYYLTKFPEIEVMVIKRADLVTAKGIEYIASMPNLRHLQLRQMNLPDGTCKILSKSKSLNSLDFGHSKNLDNKGIKVLLDNLELKMLRIAGTAATDQWIETIVAAKPRLKRMDINQTRITDKGLIKLGKLKTLKSISLSVGDGITEVGISMFKKQVPRCVVTRKTGIIFGF